MTDTALHLTEKVFPKVMVRQWVCSLPWGHRARLGYNKKLCSEVLRAFTGEVQRSLRRRAKRTLGLDSVALAHTAGITFIQRFGPAPQCPLPLPLPRRRVHRAPRREPRVRRARRAIAQASRQRRASYGTAHRRRPRQGQQGSRLRDARGARSRPRARPARPWPSAARGVDLAGDRKGQPSLRLMEQDAVQERKPVAVVAGVNVHAATAVDGRDRKRLERLCRYLARPPIAQERLELLADARLQYTLTKTWRDGTRAIVLDPMGFIARLCAMIPPPRVKMIRFHGLFAPNAKRRAQVVPQAESSPLVEASPAALAEAHQLPLFGGDNPSSKRNPWAFLLRHVFRVYVTTCPECGGPMKWLQIATESQDIRRALARMGLAPRGPPSAPPSRALFGQLSPPFGCPS